MRRATSIFQTQLQRRPQRVHRHVRDPRPGRGCGCSGAARYGFPGPLPTGPFKRLHRQPRDRRLRPLLPRLPRHVGAVGQERHSSSTTASSASPKPPRDADAEAFAAEWERFLADVQDTALMAALRSLTVVRPPARRRAGAMRAAARGPGRTRRASPFSRLPGVHLGRVRGRRRRSSATSARPSRRAPSCCSRSTTTATSTRSFEAMARQIPARARRAAGLLRGLAGHRGPPRRCSRWIRDRRVLRGVELIAYPERDRRARLARDRRRTAAS